MQRYRERQLEAPREEEEDEEDDDEIDDVVDERQPNGSTVGNGPVQIGWLENKLVCEYTIFECLVNNII